MQNAISRNRMSLASSQDKLDYSRTQSWYGAKDLNWLSAGNTLDMDIQIDLDIFSLEMNITAYLVY